ncbi:IS4 family transposase [Kistimonas scapharcae]|uniref:IS4 family transposase n=1 Tax=Kistimonas scapharcae TaxID=1036133 RepID=UPI0031F10BDC
MEEVSSLARELKVHLPWHQARIIFLAQFILSLLRGRSTNLYRVAEEFQSKAETESCYRRIKRFFAGYTYCYEQLGKLILHWLALDRYTLCMDRTNWQYGSQHINYLVVSVAWQGASIPVAWICLTKYGGNSSAKERIAIMERVLKLIPAERIDGLLADREFIGREWFEWLDKQGILCRLRIRGNISVLGRHGKDIPARHLFRNIKLNQTITWHSKRKVSGVALFIAARRSEKGLLIVVATRKPESMITDYYRRWAIETLFGCLKSRGFDLESTHMTDPERMDKLMGILALAFAWCLIVGHWRYGEAEMLPLNKHGRPAKSLFRLGLDLLRRVLKNTCSKNDQIGFLGLLDVLSRT